jgi:CheY-like chemotaxis protein
MNTQKDKPILLLIDDNKRMIVTLSDFLSYEGFDVKTAKSGEEALKKLESIKPDIIILDINMPGIGGVGFLNVLQKNHINPDCPILVFTARSAMEEFFATLDVAGFIAKPCSETDLLDKINEVLAVHSKNDASAANDNLSPKVLLGEDDSDVADQLVSKMRQYGIEFKIVASGGEIIETAATMQPDVIVLKDILPGMNGRVIVPLIRAMPSTKNVPIVLYDDTRSIEDESRYGRRIPEGVSQYLNTSEASDIIDAVRKYI